MNPNDYEDERTRQLREEARNTPAGQLLARMGRDYWDTESCARRVAEHAAEEIAAITSERDEMLAALRLLEGFISDLGDSNPGFLGKLCLQDYGRMNDAYIAMDRIISRNPEPVSP